MKVLPLNEALFDLKSGESVFIHSAACAPTPLLHELVRIAVEKNLTGVKVYHLHLDGEAPHAMPGMEKHFEVYCFFIGENCRDAVQCGRASYIPVFLSEIPSLFKAGIIKLDYALIQVSAFDNRGYATLGPSVDIALMATHTAKKVVAMVNFKMPRVWGDGVIHQRQIDVAIDISFPLHEAHQSVENQDTSSIAKHVAGLISDGATIQTGIGDIPSAVLRELKNHKDLGLHTEMFSDGAIPLIESGVITNKYKKIHPWKVVSSFAVGTRLLYDFLDANPVMQFMGADFVNDPRIILKNPKVCAINSALEIDLTGQVCADSLGSKLFSGVGGQVDFLRGAALSPGGKAIIALSSRTKKGISKIVSVLKSGSGVTSTRAHVQFIITEFGVADLRGKGLRQRAHALIAIAHPDDQEKLSREAHEMKLC